MQGYHRIQRVRDHGGVVFYKATPFTNSCEDLVVSQYCVQRKTHDDFLEVKKKITPGAIIRTTSHPDERGRQVVSHIHYLQVPEKFPKEYPNRPISDKGIAYKDPVLASISDISRRELIIKTAKIRAQIHKTLTGARFLQLATPVLQTSSAGSAARCFTAHANYNDKSYTLRTSHQFPGKKLIMMGLDRIYIKGPCFRNEDLGPRHSFEYEGVEAYYTDSGTRAERLTALRALIEEIFREGWFAAHGHYDYDGFDLREPWPMLRWEDQYHLFKADHDHIEKKIKEGDSRFPRLFHISGLDVGSCPLAASDDGVAWNVETYVDGLEVFDSYLEENLADNLKRNWQVSLQKSYLDVEFLNSVKKGLPPTTGLGLGVDRLCLAILKKTYPHINVRDIKTFPFY